MADCRHCLFYALDRWMAGGYLELRRSHHWPVAHSLHRDSEGNRRHCIPPEELSSAPLSVFGFQGEVRTHDVLGDKSMTPEAVVLSVLLAAALVPIWWARVRINNLRGR